MNHNAPQSHQYWLINIRSGNGAGARLLRALATVKGISASPIDFTRLDEQISAIPSNAMVVVAGGDGTFSSVLGSLSIGDRSVACIPLGTANDLAREIGITQKTRKAPFQDLPGILQGLSTRSFAVWNVSVNGTVKPFVNYVSIGYEGAVVSDFHRWRHATPVSGRLLNRAAYTLFGTRHALTRISGLSVETDSTPALPCAPTTGLIVTNIKSHLGLGLSNAESSPYDETIECVSVKTVFGFVSMMGASAGLLPPPSVLCKGARIRITGIPERTPLQIDGESSDPVIGGMIECHLKHFVRLCVSQ